MNEKDLQPGDVIFFVNHYLDEAGKPANHSYVDHVALFAGYTTDGTPEIVHSITGSKGHYHPEKASGLCRTTLRALKNQLQAEDGYEPKHYDVDFRVFRSADKQLSALALKLLLTQVRYKIPYDEQRLAEKLHKEDKEDYSDERFQQEGEAAYRPAGKYRSIKYAARVPLPWTRTRLDGVGRGLTCSMAVVLAYQIAELIRDKSVCSVTSKMDIGSQWVSDKYAPVPDNNRLTQSQLDYLSSLQPDKSKRTLDADLSFSCWTNDKISIEDYGHQSFPVDSKIIGAAGLFLHMKLNKTWEFYGSLNVEDRKFTVEEKQRNRAKTADDFMQALQSRRESFSHSPTSAVSNRPSPAPYKQPSRCGSMSSLSSDSSSAGPSSANGMPVPWFSFFTDTQPGADQSKNESKSTGKQLCDSSPRSGYTTPTSISSASFFTDQSPSEGGLVKRPIAQASPPRPLTNNTGMVEQNCVSDLEKSCLFNVHTLQDSTCKK